MALTKFSLTVFNKLKKVPKGRVTTYKLLAAAVGRPQAARAVGNAVHNNPCAPVVPCHRVVKSDGSLGGYAYGARKKILLLKKEGVKVKNGKIIDFKKIIYYFSN